MGPAESGDIGRTAGKSVLGWKPEHERYSMLVNSVALIMAKAATMGLGFLFWLLAARLFAPREVGIAAGAVSAIMLCTQLALLGIGSAVIFQFRHHRGRPSDLLNTAFTIVTVAALAAAGLFLLLSSTVLAELSVVASDPVYALLFLAMGVFGTVGILFDQISTVARRGHQALVRALLFGGITTTSVVALAFATDTESSLAIFSPWVLGGLIASAVGCVQLWRSLSKYRYRPGVDLSLARQLFAVGLPNHALTLAERAPGLVLPILVTELLSPEANAYWYVIWMMAWVVYIVPIQVGINVFAEAAQRPESLLAHVRHGIRSSLAFGLAGAIALALLGNVFLSLLGSGYASAGTVPLRILLVGLVPLTFVQAYFAACRAKKTLGEAIATASGSGIVGVVGATVAGIEYGLTGMAVTWVGAQGLAAIWAIFRLRSISKRGGASDETLAMAPLAAAVPPGHAVPR